MAYCSAVLEGGVLGVLGVGANGDFSVAVFNCVGCFCFCRAPADKRVLYAEIIYPFTGKPAELTMVPLLDAQGRAEVTLGFIVYHSRR